MKEERNNPLGLPSYEIGYGKPPLDRSFVKGKSGNPKGRPPRKTTEGKAAVDQSTMKQVLKAARQQVTVREGENTKSITAFEAIIQAFVVGALKGKGQSQKNLLELIDRCLKEEAAEIKKDNEFWQDYIAKYDATVLALQKAAKPIPENWPHPDDIIFEEGETVKIRGGEPAIAAQHRNYLIRVRDLFLLQSVWDRRCCPKEIPKSQQPIFLSAVVSYVVDQVLPKRMQLDDIKHFLRVDRLDGLRKPELQHQLKNTWAEFGIHFTEVKSGPLAIPTLLKLGYDVSHLQGVRKSQLVKRYRAQGV